MDVKIDSLTKYLEEIGQYPSQSFSFRGEHGKYENRLSGASRIEKIEIWPDENGRYIKPMANGYANFMTAVDKFYTTIAHKLTEVEKEQFVPFSQHYGLPTNLIDITSAPLVALFMACYSRKCCDCENAKKNGYVYIFHNNSYFIDVTDIIKYDDWNIYDSFYLGNRTVIKKIYSQIAEYFLKQEFIISGDKHIGVERRNEMLLNVFYFAIFCLEENCLLNTGKIKDGNIIKQEATKMADKAVEQFNKKSMIPFDELKKLRDKILNDPIMKRFPLDLFDGSDGYNSFLDNVGCIYTILLFYCCNRDVITGRGLHLFPNMICRPKITFDRARQQQGYFIYQGYFAIDDSILRFQDISYTHIIEIEDTDKILNQLDSIGINLGTIYGDYDSIALHLKEKLIIDASASLHSVG